MQQTAEQAIKKLEKKTELSDTLQNHYRITMQKEVLSGPDHSRKTIRSAIDFFNKYAREEGHNYNSPGVCHAKGKSLEIKDAATIRNKEQNDPK